MGSQQKQLIWQFVAVFLVALNMRMTISGVGPLLNDIAVSRGVSAATLGLLASVPLISWAIVSPLAHGISERLGMDRTITLALSALAVGTLWRSLSFAPVNLWLGTVLIGASLAVANVLMPAIVKRDFGSRTPMVMGVYSAALGGAAGIGTAVAIPVARAEVAGSPLGWELGLLASGFSIPIALLAWILVTRGSGSRAAERTASAAVLPGLSGRVWRSSTAWLLAAYMGSQAMTFFTLATWIVPITVAGGLTEVAAGTGITLFHLCCMLGALVTPFMLRVDGRVLLQVAIPVTVCAGVVGLVAVPAAAFAWLALLGLCCGVSLSISLTLIAQRSPDPRTAAAVSGMSQAVGYLIAACGPVLFGWAYDLTGAWLLPIGTAVIGFATQFVSGWILRDGRMVRA